MISNPYQLVNPTRQFQVFEIDAENFQGISAVQLFCSNFPYDSNAGNDDIWIKDIQICAVRAYTPEQLQGTMISFLVPQGLYFDSLNDPNKVITAQIKQNGLTIEPNSQTRFYWGIEDATITSISPLESEQQVYHRYLGNGWKWKNSGKYQTYKNYLELAESDTVNFETKLRDDNLYIKIYSSNNPILIGKGGNTLKALEQVLKQKINTDFGIRPLISLDVENYREKQVHRLERLAKNLAKEVIKTNVEVHLENMNAYDRRIIHNTLTDFKGIKTISEGEEPNRHVVIKPEQ